MVRVLMDYLKRLVFRRRLKVSKLDESLMLRCSPFQQQKHSIIFIRKYNKLALSQLKRM